MAGTRKAEFAHLMDTVQDYSAYTQSILPTTGIEYAQATMGSYIETNFFDTFNDDLVGQFQNEATAKRNMRWREMSEVKDSGILDELSEEDARLQEALFEIIASELSYNKSLKVLVEVEMGKLERGFDLKPGSKEHNHLFSNIRRIQSISQALCQIWEDVWCKEIHLDRNAVCRRLAEFFELEKNRLSYILYYRNVVYQQRMSVSLENESEEFKTYGKYIGENRLPLYDGFLALPFQRIPRYRILMEAVVKQLPGEDMSAPEYATIQKSLDSILTFVAQCNSAVKKMQDLEYMIELTARLDFGTMKTVALISEQRESIRHGELTRILSNPGLLQKAWSGAVQTWEIHLFNDLCLLGQVKKGNMLQVKGYCSVPQICAEILPKDKAEELIQGKLPSGCEFLIKISFFPTGDAKMGIEKDWYLFSCPTNDAQVRWIQALTPQIGVTDKECGQLTTFTKGEGPIVQVIRAYVGNHADELTIHEGEVLQVLGKIQGSTWWEGEKLSNGEFGWFPGNYTVEVTDPKQRMAIVMQQNKVLQMTTRFQATHPNLKEQLFSLRDMEAFDSE